MVGDPTVSLHTWKQLARWSIEYSCLSEEQKEMGLGHLDKDWAQFCTTVVAVYGGLVTETTDGAQEDRAGKHTM